MFWIAFSLLTGAACSGDSVEYHHARAAIAIAYCLTSQPANPHSDKCEACNGAGEVGDGVIMTECEACDGTGRRQAVQQVIEWDETVTEEPQGNTCYMITANWCGPCQSVKRKASELIGSGKPIQLIEITERPRYAAELKIKHAKTIPCFVVLNSMGTEIDRITGGQTLDSLNALLATHRINRPRTEANDAETITATLNMPPSWEAVAGVLASHLARQEEHNLQPVGGLFDRHVKVSPLVPQLLAQLMIGEPIAISTTGITATWHGEDRVIEFQDKHQITMQPPIDVQINKWGLSLATHVTGLHVSDNGSTVKIQLRGPDLTIRFQGAE